MKTMIFALSGISLLAGTAVLAQPAERQTGPMTRAEATQKSAERFQKMDLNSDGVLDLTDRELRRKQKIARIDTDGNNAISKAEREAAKEARQARRAERLAERGDKAELRGERRGKGKRGMRGMRGHRGGAAMAARADTNGDGRLTLQEFQTAALTRFDRADADKNGTVTQEERKAARDAMRAEMRAKKAERMEQRRAQRAGQ